MALNEPKMRSITGKLVANKLTERDDDFSFNVTYQANRSVKDLCKLAATNSKFTASELESAYNDLMAQAKIELYNASTVEFGFANNSLGVDGPFIGPDAKFDPSVNNVTLRCSPRIEFKEDLKNISVLSPVRKKDCRPLRKLSMWQPAVKIFGSLRAVVLTAKATG